MTQAPTLRTPRLVLEPLRMDHAAGLWAAVDSSRAPLREWMDWAQDPQPSDTPAFIGDALPRMAAGNEDHFTILHEGVEAGVVSLVPLKPAYRSREIGYWMRADLHGKGLMTEAAAHVIRCGFETRELHRIELHAALGNFPSIKIAEKLGFNRRGILRDASKAAAGWLDVYVYDLLETDERLWEGYL